MIHLTIPGRPVPKGTMTARSKHSARGRRTLDYQELVATAALAIRPRPLLWKYVALEITVYLKADANGDLPARRGDGDNYIKSIQDGLQYAGVFANDKCVTDPSAKVRPCSSTAEERAEVILREAVL